MRWAPLAALVPIALGIGAAVWLIKSAPGPAQVAQEVPPVPVRVMTVAPQDVRPMVTAWANVRAAKTWVAVSEVRGQVIWRHPDLRVGRLIPAGTEVLRTDPAEYEWAQAQAQADLSALAAERNQVNVEETNTARVLKLERKRQALVEEDLARKHALRKENSISKASIDEAERAVLQSRRTVTELENALALMPSRQARITAQLAKAQSAWESAGRALEHTVLKAPFDLRVNEVQVERFQSVAPGQVMVRGDGLDAVEVVVQVPLDDMRQLVGVEPESASLEALLRRVVDSEIGVTVGALSSDASQWTGHISRLEGALDVRAQTVPVVVNVDQPYESINPATRMPLLPNMRVQVTFTGVTMKGVIEIPESALRAGMVRIVGPDNRLQLRAAKTTMTQGDHVILAEGVAPGERVVLDDVAPAIEGMALLPVEASK